MARVVPLQKNKQPCKQTCKNIILDPDEYERFKKFHKKIRGDIKELPNVESITESCFLLEIFIDKIKLTPIIEEVDDADEFLDDETKKRKEMERLKKEAMKAKLLTRVKFIDFPTMEIELEEYKEPVIIKKKKQWIEWTLNEDEDEDDEKNWMQELKAKMKLIEKEELEKEQKEANAAKNKDEEEKEKLANKIANEEVIGRSCFFQMAPAQLLRAIINRKLEISVYQIGDPRTNTRAKLIGNASVHISPNIRTVITRASDPYVKVPVTATSLEQFNLFSNIENRNTAEVTMVIRLVGMGYTTYPLAKNLPRPLKKPVTEIETFLNNIKAIGKNNLAKICPMNKELRKTQPFKD